MKTTATICLSLFLVAGWTFGARGQSFRTDINPALQYYQAFLLAPDPMPEADMDFLYSREGRGQKLPDRFGALFAGYDNQFKLVRQAAHAAVPCDWGIDMTAGPATLLPHLARAKAVTQAARLRVMWQLQQGKADAACEEWLAVMALGHNVARDGTLIGNLVQAAIEAINCNTLAENFGRFPPEPLKQLLTGLGSIPARGTIAASMPHEKAFFHDWTVRKIHDLQQRYPGNDAKVMEGIHEFLGTSEPDPNGTNLWGRVVAAAGGTSEGILRLLQERERAYEQLATLMALPYADYQARIKDLSAELENSSNPFVSTVLPAFLKARSREFKLEVWLSMVRAAVEYRLHGEAGLQQVLDPCGQRPFAFQRFVFEGVDRGFQLKSAYDGSGFPEALIFVEKEGPAFRVDGPHIGEAVPAAKK